MGEPQNAGTRGKERHGPGLHHALPRIVARGPLRGLGVGGVAAGVGGRVAAAVVPVATTIRAVVGARVPATVAVAGSVVGALGGRGGGPVLGTGGDRAGGAAGVVAVGRGEGLPSLGVGVVLEAELLKDEEAAGALEGVRRELGGDHRLDVAVPGVEAAEKIQHLARLGDGVADVTQLVGDALQLGTVVVHRHVALLERAQLGFEEAGTLQLIVMEEGLDGVPEGESVMVVTAHDIVDALGDRCEDPVDDAGINPAPLAIADVVRCSGVDVVLQPELAEGGLEEMTPLTEVAVVHLKNDGNMVADGDPLDLGGGGWSDGEAVVGRRIRGRVRRGSHGSGSCMCRREGRIGGV